MVTKALIRLNRHPSESWGLWQLHVELAAPDPSFRWDDGIGMFMRSQSLGRSIGPAKVSDGGHRFIELAIQARQRDTDISSGNRLVGVRHGPK